MEKAAALKILTGIIQIASVNGKEAEVADYIESCFKGKKAKVEHVTFAEGRDNLVVTIGEKGPMLGFSGHEDVVSAGDEKDWKFPAFSGTIHEGFVYGRGASDMKSGLAAQVVAMLDLLESGEPLVGQIRLLASVGEETGEYGAAQLTKEGYTDELAGLVIGEPSAFDVRVTHKGVIDYYVTSIGKSAHSSRPDSGKNAIFPLIKFAEKAQKLMDAHDTKDPELGGLTHVISQVHGGEQINSIPAKAWLSGNIRTIPAYHNDEIYKELNALVEQLNQEGAELSIRYSYPEVPLPSQAETDLAKLASHLLKEKFNKSGELLAGTGATDASEYIQSATDFPIIIVGPGAGLTDHQVDECVAIEDYLTGCAFYKELAQAFWEEKN